MVRNSNGIVNRPVSRTDITNARVIYVADLTGAQGENFRKKKITVETGNCKNQMVFTDSITL